MDYGTSLDYIRSRVPADELLTGLAEEAAELAQAALKYRRARGISTNPTPVSEDEALAALVEEVADVALYLGVLRLIKSVTGLDELLAKHIDLKTERWAMRLGGMQP